MAVCQTGFVKNKIGMGYRQIILAISRSCRNFAGIAFVESDSGLFHIKLFFTVTTLKEKGGRVFFFCGKSIIVL
jgi:hypothetical protein